jgi:hypothetical protein
LQRRIDLIERCSVLALKKIKSLPKVELFAHLQAMESSQVPLPFRIRLGVFERQQEDEFHVFFFEGDMPKDLKDKEKDKEFDPAELARPFVFWKEAEPLKENRLHLNAILQAQEAYLQVQKASGELSGSGNWSCGTCSYGLSWPMATLPGQQLQGSAREFSRSLPPNTILSQQNRLYGTNVPPF